MSENLLTASDAGRLLGVTALRVRQLANDGRLPVALRTLSGWRLFLRADVERLVAERASRRVAP